MLKKLRTLQNPLTTPFIRLLLMACNGLVSKDLEVSMTEQLTWFHLLAGTREGSKIDINSVFFSLSI